MTQEEIGNLMLEIRDDNKVMAETLQELKEHNKKTDETLQELKESINYMKFMDEKRDEKIAGLVDGHKVIMEKLNSIDEKLESHQFELDDHDIRISVLESKKVANQ